MALAGVPRGVDYDAVHDALSSLDGVVAVHDLHIWGVSTRDTVLTAHLVIPDGRDVIPAACTLIRERFGIDHVTLQSERVDLQHGCF